MIKGAPSTYGSLPLLLHYYSSTPTATISFATHIWAWACVAGHGGGRKHIDVMNTTIYYRKFPSHMIKSHDWLTQLHSTACNALLVSVPLTHIMFSPLSLFLDSAVSPGPYLIVLA